MYVSWRKKCNHAEHMAKINWCITRTSIKIRLHWNTGLPESPINISENKLQSPWWFFIRYSTMETLSKNLALRYFLLMCCFHLSFLLPFYEIFCPFSHKILRHCISFYKIAYLNRFCDYFSESRWKMRKVDG